MTVTTEAKTAWKGGLIDGAGQVAFQSSGICTFDVNWKARSEGSTSVTTPEELIAAVNRLKKKLGGLRTQEAIDAILAGNHEAWISNLLLYYDKTYEFDLARHEKGQTVTLDLGAKLIEDQLALLLKFKNQHDAKSPYPTH